MSAEEKPDQKPTSKLLDFPGEAVLDSLSAHIAILDVNGIILKTNKSWMSFASDNDVSIRPDMVGVNYLALCDNTPGDEGSEAKNVAEGIRKVISGKAEEYLTDYACHSPSEKRWFYMRVTRLNSPGPLRIVVSHENITALKLAEQALKERETELNEMNSALKILLKQREKDKAELEQNVITNLKNLVIPYIEKLKKTELDDAQSRHLSAAESHLKEITSPFLHSISSSYQFLTPREVEIAGEIRNGKTTKEIAAATGVSESTVVFHRKNIRRKLGLTKNGENLRTFLLSLED